MKSSGIQKLVMGAAVVAAIVLGTICFADNPIIQTKYTADPAPMVYNDTIYLYTSHDEDDATGFKMLNWLCYTSTDMANWTDHGIVASLSMFSWAAGYNAWAPQCISRNGKFYLYCPLAQKIGRMAIGVAVSTSPTGPFVDAIGKPLIANSGDDIDPTVFIDDDGQAYLYWGNPNVYYVKLNQDMISYSGSIVKVSTKPRNYQEGPWFYQRNGNYYLTYSSTCCPEGIGYAMSDSPTGPWAYKGYIMEPNRASSGNQPGIIDYKGNTYCFGFNYSLLRQTTTARYERRCVCVDIMNYNADGTIQTMPWWSTSGPPQIGTLNPYVQTEAATICWEIGVRTKSRGGDKRGVYVSVNDNGGYIKVKGVDFGQGGAGTFAASAANGVQGGTIELHLDGVDGAIIGILPVPYTGDWEIWKTRTAAISGASGIHDLYFVFKGETKGHLFNVDNWKFEKKKAVHDLVAVTAALDRYKIDTNSGNRTATIKVQAVYADGTSQDVTAEAEVTAAKSGVVKINKGVITGAATGSTDITATFGGKADTVIIVVADENK